MGLQICCGTTPSLLGQAEEICISCSEIAVDVLGSESYTRLHTASKGHGERGRNTSAGCDQESKLFCLDSLASLKSRASWMSLHTAWARIEHGNEARGYGSQGAARSLSNEKTPCGNRCKMSSPSK